MPQLTCPTDSPSAVDHEIIELPECLEAALDAQNAMLQSVGGRACRQRLSQLEHRDPRLPTGIRIHSKPMVRVRNTIMAQNTASAIPCGGGDVRERVWAFSRLLVTTSTGQTLLRQYLRGRERTHDNSSNQESITSVARLSLPVTRRIGPNRPNLPGPPLGPGADH
jgi:hypothetical protein